MTARICLAIALFGAPLIVAGATCDGIEDIEERLSCLEEQYCADSASADDRAVCYEAIVRKLLTDTAETRSPEVPESTTVAPAPAPEPADSGTEHAVTEAGRATAVEDSAIQARSSPSEDVFGRKPELPSPEPDRIVANVATVVEEHDGRLLVALDNGQVWEENEPPGRPRRIKIGSEVGVSKIMFGYVMRFENGNTVRVSRLECDSRHAEDAVRSKCRRAGYASRED
jgi:hypothetical protein